MVFSGLVRSNSSRRLRQSNKNTQITLLGEMTRINRCCAVVSCLPRTSRDGKQEGDGFLPSLLDSYGIGSIPHLVLPILRSIKLSCPEAEKLKPSFHSLK